MNELALVLQTKGCVCAWGWFGGWVGSWVERGIQIFVFCLSLY